MQIKYEDLVDFKDKYDGYKIIYLSIFNKQFVFKSLTLKEYNLLLLLIDNDIDMENMICNLTCLYPENYNFKNCPYAGLPEKAAEEVLKNSYLSNANEVNAIYNEKLEQLGTFNTQCACLIKAAFPEVSFEDIENYTMEKNIDMCIKAELVLRLRGINIDKENNFANLIKQFIQISSTTITDDKKTVNSLIRKGIDPMKFFKNKIKIEHELIDIPVISGGEWQDEVILDEIRKQMAK